MDARIREIVSGFSFLEGPRWHDDRLWLSDFYMHRVMSIDADGRVTTVAEVPGQPSGLGWLPDGRLLVSSMRDRRVLRLETDGRLVEHADLSSIATGHINDMVVGADGTAWVGNFGFDLMGGAPIAPARLASVTLDGTVRVAAEGLHFPNGSMITPDGKTLIVCESTGNRISAFDIVGPGQLGPRRDWAVFGPLPQSTDATTVVQQAVVTPDGAVLDAEGAVWCADVTHHRVLRVAEGGHILQEISTGDMGVFACTLGGADRRTLYLCVAPDSWEHNRAPSREAALWAVQVEVPGAGRP